MRLSVTAAVASAALFGTAPAVLGEIVSFDIDSSRSSLTLSGAVRFYFNGSVFGFAEQGPGSLVASYGGTITGDLVGSDLAFSGGSVITGLANPSGPFMPSGPAVTDVYGMQTFSAGGGQAFNRMYDLTLDLMSGVASDGVAFGGDVAYIGDSGGIFPFFDALPRTLVGVTATNATAGSVSLISDGFVQTLTIPIDVNLVLFGNGTGVETRLTGALVATRAVPGPGAIGLLALAACGSLRRRQRSR